MHAWLPQVVQNVWEATPCTGTLAHSYPQGKGITGQDKVAQVWPWRCQRCPHTPWLGRPARTQRVGWAFHGPPSAASPSCPGTWASDISSLLPSLKNMGTLSSTGVKSDLNPPSGTKLQTTPWNKAVPTCYHVAPWFSPRACLRSKWKNHTLGHFPGCAECLLIKKTVP